MRRPLGVASFPLDYYMGLVDSLGPVLLNHPQSHNNYSMDIVCI